MMRFMRTIDIYKKEYSYIGNVELKNGIMTVRITQELLDLNFDEEEFRFFGRKLTKSDIPVRFIFENLNFNIPATIDIRDEVQVFFHNCNFYGRLRINNGGELTLDHNLYNQGFSISGGGYLRSSFGNVCIKNEGFSDSFDGVYYQENADAYSIYGNKIIIVDSNLIAKDQGIHLWAVQEIRFLHSKVEGSRIDLFSIRIHVIDSLLKAEEKITMRDIKSTFHGDVDTPLFVYNGESIYQKSIKK